MTRAELIKNITQLAAVRRTVEDSSTPRIIKNRDLAALDEAIERFAVLLAERLIVNEGGHGG